MLNEGVESVKVDPLRSDLGRFPEPYGSPGGGDCFCLSWSCPVPLLLSTFPMVRIASRFSRVSTICRGAAVIPSGAMIYVSLVTWKGSSRLPQGNGEDHWDFASVLLGV